MNTIRRYKLSLPIILIAGFIYSYLAWNMQMGQCPDEHMRYPVAQWIVSHNSLPTGYEEELINPTWGFSYALLPYFPTMAGAVFMKCISIFTHSEHLLLFACRFVEVIAGSIDVFLCFRIGDKLFHNKVSVYMLAIFVGFLPQIAYLSGYINNDVVSLMSCFIIFDALLTGTTGWTLKKSLYLASGVSFCMLTYYFAYMWVIIAIVGYIFTSYKSTQNKIKTAKGAGTVAMMVFVMAGWYFIRNIIIYNGDVFGLNQTAISASMYEAEGHEVFHGISAQDHGMSFREMMLDNSLDLGWIRTTTRSLLGQFGYMAYTMPEYVYDFYKWFLRLGLFLLVYFKEKTKLRKSIVFSLIISVIAVVAISAYNSFYNDYQSQGRYILSAIPAIGTFVIAGYDALGERLASLKFVRKSKVMQVVAGNAVQVVLSIALIGIFIYVLKTVMIPNLF